MGTLKESDLTPEIRKMLGLPQNRKRMTKDDVRGYAIRCLAPLAGLTRTQRVHVLDHAKKMDV